MISLCSRWQPPANQVTVRKGRDHAGDGYVPPYDYGSYELIPYAETDLPRRNPGSSPPYTPVPNYRPGMGVTPGLERNFVVAAAEAIRHPGIAGTAPPNVDPRTWWGPLVTIQQTAIQAALAQKRSVN
jgi:hypothetical protein